MTKVLMFYEVAPDGLQKAREHFASHRARLDEFHARHDWNEVLFNSGE